MKTDRRETKVFESIHNISKLYVGNMNKVQELISSIEGVTCNLDARIEELLRKQELEFVKAYRCHLHNLSEVLKAKDEQLSAKQKQLKFFENEGALSVLIQKTKKLEEQISLIYQKSLQKDKTLNDCRLDNKILKMENKRLTDEIKRFIREKQANKIQLMLDDKSFDKKQTRKHLITEIADNNRITDMFMTHAHTRSLSEEACMLVGLDSQPPNDHEDNNNKLDSVSKLQIQNIKLSRQFKTMNSKYSRLLKDKVDRQSSRTELEEFFFECIEEVKKSICDRKKTLSCDFRSFRSDDKMKVLLILLTHQEIVKCVHKLVFHQAPTKKDLTNHSPEMPDGKSQGVFSLLDEPQLPKIKVEQLRARSLIHRRLRVTNGRLQS